MLLIKRVTLTPITPIISRQIYIVLKNSQDVLVSRVEKIRSSSAEWNIDFLLEKDQCCKVTVEVWDYNGMSMLGRDSISKSELENQGHCCYTGLIGLPHQEIKLNIAFEIVGSRKQAKVQKVTAKQTKRTESTNRQSNNSLTQIIEQPSYIKQYQLINSISERNVRKFNSKWAIFESKSTQKVLSPKRNIA